MGLPLPKVVSDVGPGGRFVTDLGGINALANNMSLRKYNDIKAKYAPITLQAEAMSKLAYANLMGPQFAAKMLGNNALVANMGDANANTALGKVLGAVNGQGSGNSLLGMPGMSGSGRSSNSIGGGLLFNLIKKILPNNNTSNQGSEESAVRSPQQYSAPSEEIDAESAPSNPEPATSSQGIFSNNDPKLWDAMEAWIKSPEGKKKLSQNPNYMPPEEELRNSQYYPKDESSPMELTLTKAQQMKKDAKTWAEKAADFEGVLAEGKESGKIRSGSQKELDQDYQQSLQLKTAFEPLNKIITNPVFQNLRNLPGFQQQQLNIKSKIGNAEEQKLIGQFQAAAQNVVASTVKGFGGRILASEIPLAESMKLTGNDTIGVMLGKAPVIEYFNEMTLQRSRLASQLMKRDHIGKGDALEQADKMLDGNAIRKSVEEALQTKESITDDDINHTAQAMGMTREQVIQRLKSEGRYNG